MSIVRRNASAHPRIGILACAAALALGGACSDSGPAPQPEPQAQGTTKAPPADHILLVVIDTLRADHLGAMGYPRPTSPHFDELASQGVLCTNAISQASWTSPSMISMMTGRYIARERLDIPADLATLGETFQAAGWATAGFSSNELVSEKNGFARGFDHFQTIKEHDSDEPITKWIRETADRPALTYVQITEPHDPYQAPPDRTRWRTEGGFLPGDRADFYPKVTQALGLVGTDELEKQVETEIGGYDDEVLYADGRVGAMLDALDEAGIRDRTIVVVTSDHGEGLWQRVALMNGDREKALREGQEPNLLNTLQETHGNLVTRELVHVPLVLAGPNLPKGVPVNSLVEGVDLYPTLLELTGMRPISGLQGRSILRRLEGDSDVKPYAFSFTRFNMTVIDSDGWSLILPTDEGECNENLSVQLYRLGDDPYQRRNLAAEHPEVVQRLQAEADQRVRVAITEHGDLTGTNATALVMMGYLDLAQREENRAQLHGWPVAQVVDELTRDRTPCTMRLLAAESLLDRELDDTARARLVEWRDKMETSDAVKRVLDEVLGG